MPTARPKLAVTTSGAGRVSIGARHTASLQTLGELPGGVRLVEPVDEHDELVAAEARHRVTGAHAARHRASQSPEHVVADGVAERVVDVLHRIDVGQDHRNPAPVVSGARPGRPEDGRRGSPGRAVR